MLRDTSDPDLFSYDPNDPFPIERGVPVASDRSASRNATWPKPEFPFSRMVVGESFVVRPEHCGDAPLIVTQNIVSSAASAYCQEFAPEARPKFTTRQQGGRFVRCWRIS